MRARAGFVIGTVAAVSVAVAGIGTAATASSRTLPGPDQVGPLRDGPGYHRLQAVEDIGPGDVWAAGFRKQNFQQLLTHYDGRRWRSSTGPYTGLGSSLHSLQSFGPDDVWVVGNAGVPSFIAHWDGAEWTQVPSPSPGAYNNVLTGVSGVAPDDVWAVGESRIDSSGAEVAVADHWDGSTWTQVPTQNPASVQLFYDVDAIAADDVWAVGATNAGGPLVEHWDGSTWSLVDQPVLHGTLVGIVGFAPDDVWAVGHTTQASGGAPFGPLLEHWDGASWSVVQGLSIDSVAELNGLAGTSTNDVWAVGCSLRDVRGGRKTVIEHYDGTTWTRVPSPNPQPYASQCMTAVGTSAPDEAWTIGTYGYNNLGTGLAHTLLAHWNGIDWTWDRRPRA
jgi:hypothetical protein